MSSSAAVGLALRAAESEPISLDGSGRVSMSRVLERLARSVRRLEKHRAARGCTVRVPEHPAAAQIFAAASSRPYQTALD